MMLCLTWSSQQQSKSTMKPLKPHGSRYKSFLLLDCFCQVFGTLTKKKKKNILPTIRLLCLNLNSNFHTYTIPSLSEVNEGLQPKAKSIRKKGLIIPVPFLWHWSPWSKIQKTGHQDSYSLLLCSTKLKYYFLLGGCKSYTFIIANLYSTWFTISSGPSSKHLFACFWKNQQYTWILCLRQLLVPLYFSQILKTMTSKTLNFPRFYSYSICGWPFVAF
jgi:hypothetical protein